MDNINIPPGALEAAAKDIYEHWQFNAPKQYPWRPDGNSLMQQKARDFARAACLAMIRNWPQIIRWPEDAPEGVIIPPMPFPYIILPLHKENSNDRA